MIRLRLLLLLPLCLLIGCNRPAASTTPPIATGFSCSAVGTYHGEAVAGTLRRSTAGLLTVTLTQPKTLDGLVMEWNGETVTLSLLGLQWSLDPADVPQAALGQQILQALDSLVYGEGHSEAGEDGRVATAAPDGSFTWYSDPATGALLALEVPGEELSLTFSDFVKT